MPSFNTLQVFNWETVTQDPGPYVPVFNPYAWEFQSEQATGDGTIYPVKMLLPEMCLWLRRAREVRISYRFQTSTDPTEQEGTLTCFSASIQSLGSLPQDEISNFLYGIIYQEPTVTGTGGNMTFGMLPQLLHKTTGHDSELDNWYPRIDVLLGSEVVSLIQDDFSDPAPFNLELSAVDPVTGNNYTNTIALFVETGVTFIGTQTATMEIVDYWPYSP